MHSTGTPIVPGSYQVTQRADKSETAGRKIIRKKFKEKLRTEAKTAKSREDLGSKMISYFSPYNVQLFHS